MPKPISAIDAAPYRVVIVTLDAHLASAAEKAARILAREIPGLTLSLHAAAEWASDPASLARCRNDILDGDIVIATMLFLDEHIRAVLPQLEARREQCDAMLGCMSAGEVIRLTRIGRFNMGSRESGTIAWLKRLRGAGNKRESSGAQQMAMLKRIPRFLRFIPGTAQDVRTYFLSMQYWLAGSDDNLVNLIRHLVNRYAGGAHQRLRGKLKVAPPADYPDVGIYHPRLPERLTDNLARLPAPPTRARGTVGLLVMRAYVLAGNTAHYDGVIAALEKRGLRVLPVFASGLDSRPAIERYFVRDGQRLVDAVVSLTGFSLVGGPAYNDARAAADTLSALDVPYLAAQALEFQTIEEWTQSPQGLSPLEATMMVAIPEIDGATGAIVYGGRSSGNAADGGRDMHAHAERIEVLAARLDKLVALRRGTASERKVAIVVFNFPPNAGAVGTAAYLDVFASLFNLLVAMRGQGYKVGELPASAAALRDMLLTGNAARHGAEANVCARITADDHVRREPWLAEIEAQWGPAPGRQNSDGEAILVLGLRFGNVLVAVQPAFGYEGDPMRLLFDGSFAPTHAFSAFYRYLREDFAADVCLHFGTHGALEFMPGKQAGLSSRCWPERLIGDLPNIYLYAANNPSEGTIAKRRAAATLVSYLTPPVTHAGLYRGLHELKDSLERWRARAPATPTDDDDGLRDLIRTQAAELDLAVSAAADDEFAVLGAALLELEQSLIPCGLHIVGEPMPQAARGEILAEMANAAGLEALPPAVFEALAGGAAAPAALAAANLAGDPHRTEVLGRLALANAAMSGEHELAALLHALDGRFVRPVPGGDLLRTPDILPTGRNLHGFDPFRIPSAFAVKDGARQADKLLERHLADGNTLPRTVAVVLWGTDNLKSEGAPLAQALALLGARPRFDSYGRLCGAELVPIAELGRPRIDVVMTLSGIFRDLLPLQTRILAEAALLAASADEAPADNFVRQHALAYQAEHGCDLETAALRVFSNADGAYGSNVNQLVDSGAWSDEDELAETYTARKCFAYGTSGKAVRQPAMLGSVLADVDLAYQNLESVELGVTTIDHYFDTLGGIGRAVQRARGAAVPVYITDQTQSAARVRTLAEQVALETRTRMLNPKWYEGLLEHGYEGVRQIEAHVTNTMGWSATTGQVAPWVYQQLTQTYILDDAMRARIAGLNPQSSARVANRLLEAHERNYWSPDEATLAALRRAGDELEDRMEGIFEGVAA